MSLLDTIQGGLARILPRKSASAPSGGGGVGNVGVVSYDDDVSLPHLLSIHKYIPLSTPPLLRRTAAHGN